LESAGAPASPATSVRVAWGEVLPISPAGLDLAGSVDITIELVGISPIVSWE